MAIKRIEVSNFKSFDRLDLDLGNFNIFIGANASGKSNLISVFHFLRDIPNFGLSNAISMQGGIEYIRNIKIGSSKMFSVKVVSDHKFGFQLGSTLIDVYETTYQFAIKFTQEGLGFRILNDRLTQSSEVFKLVRSKGRMRKSRRLGPGQMTVSRSRGKVNVRMALPKEVRGPEKDLFHPLIAQYKIPPRSVLAEAPVFTQLLPPTHDFAGNISIYNFDPKWPKIGFQITGKADLEEDGRNLALVLKNLIESKEKKRKLSNLIKDVLPFVDDLDVEKFADKSLLFKVRESYFKDEYLPASLLSDGTINVTALIIALYFESEPLTIVEEPERNAHPHLISRLVQMMKDASRSKQIIVTTHNPEVIKHAEPSDIFLVSRDSEGFSTVSKPADKKHIKVFLEDDMGIDELYIHNLLDMGR